MFNYYQIIKQVPSFCCLWNICKPIHKLSILILIAINIKWHLVELFNLYCNIVYLMQVMVKNQSFCKYANCERRLKRLLGKILYSQNSIYMYIYNFCIRLIQNFVYRFCLSNLYLPKIHSQTLLELTVKPNQENKIQITILNSSSIFSSQLLRTLQTKHSTKQIVLYSKISRYLLYFVIT